MTLTHGDGQLYVQTPLGSWRPIAATPSTTDDERDILDRIDDVVEDWEAGADVARWAADGSHEHDPPGWTRRNVADPFETLDAIIALGLEPGMRAAAQVIGDRVADMQRQLVLWGEAWVERVLGDVESWRPMGIAQMPRFERRTLADAALARWDETRERARRRSSEEAEPDGDPSPTDPRERALRARQLRGTGPASPRLDGRRR